MYLYSKEAPLGSGGGARWSIPAMRCKHTQANLASSSACLIHPHAHLLEAACRTEVVLTTA